MVNFYKLLLYFKIFIKIILKRAVYTDFKGIRMLRVYGRVILSGHCIFEGVVKVGKNVSFSNCTIGKYSYFSTNSKINNCRIGAYCSIAPNVIIGLGSHLIEKAVSVHPAFYLAQTDLGVAYADKDYTPKVQEIVIGNDVWIGTNAIIKDGIIVGDGAIIGAGAVVTKNVPPYAIVGGVPAKLIRYRFNQEQIEFLLNTKWWDKEELWLKDNFKYFLNIDKFMNNFK